MESLYSCLKRNQDIGELVEIIENNNARWIDDFGRNISLIDVETRKAVLSELKHHYQMRFNSPPGDADAAEYEHSHFDDPDCGLKHRVFIPKTKVVPMVLPESKDDLYIVMIDCIKKYEQKNLITPDANTLWEEMKNCDLSGWNVYFERNEIKLDEGKTISKKAFKQRMNRYYPH